MIAKLARCALLMAALTAFHASGARAQEARSQTQGLLLGFSLTGSSLEVEDGERESGGGGGLMAGWGVSRSVTLFLRGDLTSIDISSPEIFGTYGLILIDLGTRITFSGPERQFVPNITLAVTGITASADIRVTPVLSTNVKVTGGGFTVGGGFQHYFTPGLALDLQALLTIGSFSEVEIGDRTREIDKLDATAGRFTAGLSWHPRR